jgi:Ca-activated chloride channel family protein
MKCPVAFLSVATSVVLLAATVPGQNPRKGKVKERARASPQRATIEICQGVPIPSGYTVTAYKTSSACPHGAYLLKKQETESQSPAANNRGDKTSVAPQAVSRPRRVSTRQPETDLDSLRGAPTQPYGQPPTMAGMTPIATSVSTPTNTVPVSEPEEVSEGDVVRIDTTLVTVPVSVLDRQGRFVPNLGREDFSVFENGIEQPIAYFEPTEKPFTVALLLDTSASTRFHLWEIKEAAIAFAKQLRPQDRVLVVTFSDEVLLLTEATNDSAVVSLVIQQNAQSGSSTRLYDAVDLVVRERLNQIQGRKAIVLFTDGVDTSSYLATYQSTVRQAEELDALVYPIQYDTTDYLRAMQGGGNVTIVTRTSRWPFPGRSSSQVIYGTPSTGGIVGPGTTAADYKRANSYLHELADKTGARLYQANDSAQLAQAFTRIAEELRRQYSLGYYPSSPISQDGERRQIKVRVRQPDLAVRARNGYVRSSSKVAR